MAAVAALTLTMLAGATVPGTASASTGTSPDGALSISMADRQELPLTGCQSYPVNLTVNVAAGVGWRLTSTVARTPGSTKNRDTLFGTGPLAGANTFTNCAVSDTYWHGPGLYTLTGTLDTYPLGTHASVAISTTTFVPFVKAPVRGSIAASPTTVKQHATFRLTGQFTYLPRGSTAWRPVVGTIKLYFMPKGGTAWTLLANGSTDPRGDFMFNPVTTITGSYLVAYPGTATVSSANLVATILVVK